MKKNLISLSAVCLFLFFVQVNISFAEVKTYEKAQHRLPPVIYSLDIPKTVTSGESYDFKWTVMGYHDTYDIEIVVREPSGAAKHRTVSPYKVTEGEYYWSNIQSRQFFYSTNLTFDFSGYLELEVRFFASPVDDPIDNSFLSCIVPGGLGYQAADSTGRKINIYGVPSDSLGLDISMAGYTGGAVENDYFATDDKAYSGFDDAYWKILSVGDNSRIIIRFMPNYDRSSDSVYSYKFVLPWDIKVSSININNSKQASKQAEIEELAVVRDEVVGKILGVFSFPINLFFASIPLTGDPAFTSYMEDDDMINKTVFPYQTFQGLFSREFPYSTTQFVIDCDMSLGELMKALKKYKMSFYVGSTPGNEVFIEGLRVK
ncbi:MAG: hypothetical protein D3921_10975 [Candidatus Electrothrix sp. AW1]|nr:hypothetical protein [Candidatus Electrothrix gigas]